jgi:hypothetical protein
MMGALECTAYHDLWVERVGPTGVAELEEEGFNLRELVKEKRHQYAHLRKMTWWGAFLSFVAS